MKRINTPTAVSNKFVDGNPLTGAKGTQLSAEFFNQVQEEICNLIEAAGLTVGASDHQLKDIFTIFYLLDAKLKSLKLLKSFSGGNSVVEIDGESISLSVAGESVHDNGEMEMSHTGFTVRSSSEGGETHVSIDSGKLEVSYSSSSASYKWVMSRDGLKFYLGDSNSASAEFSVDPSTGVITISDTGGLKVKNRSSFERINLGDSKSYFHYPDTSSVNINTLLENSSIEVAVGDVITIKCDFVNGNGLQVSFAESNSMTGRVLISSYCAMQFICTSIVSSESRWAPLCNTSVSVT